MKSLGLFGLLGPAFAECDVRAADFALVAHRGGTPDFPQASMAAYQAVANISDYLECDLTITKDGVMICQHEPDLSVSTNAKESRFRSLLPQHTISREWLNPVLDFEDSGYRRTAFLRDDAKPHDGWYTPDWEYSPTIESLSAPGGRNDHHFPLARLDEVWDLAVQTNIKRSEAVGDWTVRDAPLGVYLEIKHSTWHQGRRNRDMLTLLLDYLQTKSLSKHRFDMPFPVYLQTFEIGDLIRLRQRLGFDSNNIWITGLTTVLHTTYGLAPDCCSEDEHLRRKLLRAFKEDEVGKFVRLPGTFGEMFFGSLGGTRLAETVGECLDASKCGNCSGVIGGLKILPISLDLAQDLEDSGKTEAEKRSACEAHLAKYAKQMFLTCPTNGGYNLNSFYAFQPLTKVSHAVDVSCLVDTIGVDLRYVRRHPQLIQQAHERCVRVHLWTIKTPSDMDFVLEHSPDGIFTDDVQMSEHSRFLKRSDYRSTTLPLSGDTGPL